MRCMNRNKRVFYYAAFLSESPIYDEWGNETTEHNVSYAKPLKYSANISAAKGETETRQFGESESYDRVIVMDADCPQIDEHSVLWIDTLPTFDEDGNTATPHDYVVKKVARSLNSVSLAVSKVNVS